MGETPLRLGLHLELFQAPGLPANPRGVLEGKRSISADYPRLSTPFPSPRSPRQGGWAYDLATLPVVLLAALLLPRGGRLPPSLDSDFTFTLPAGQKKCFYQPMPLKASLEIEYQVLDGAGLDIDFHLASPERKNFSF